MGTRATVKFFEKFYNDKNKIKTYFLGGVYVQMDGYIEGLGKDIKDILKDKELINGICGQGIETSFNGMRCLGAYVIGKLKGDNIGNVYLTDKKDCQQYNYEIYNIPYNIPDNKTIRREIQICIKNSSNKILYKGLLNNMPETDDENEIKRLYDMETGRIKITKLINENNI
jgi:hypothetical protein